MKRPLGLWILLSAGIIWLNTQDVHGARATSLIFAKTSTTSTTTSRTTAEKSEEEPDTTETDGEASGNSTKPVLTGIPQIDYIWDPNLPKELNGYNLSDYPFYERVPANITFKCDGLHDGFYASVIHKCQVYHHCLFGIRYDFLCANYTAFDQTLFNCNFVSKVDCKNSKNFWSRNDDLYKTKATPAPPPIVQSYYTQAPPAYPPAGVPLRRNPLLRRIPPPNVNRIPVEAGPGQQLPAPTVQSGIESPTDAPIGSVPQVPVEVSVPLAPRRRPFRPRPYYDYYDEYDEPQYYRRKRPRPRPYYDDEEEYEYYDDDRYERRGEGRRRRPMRRYQGRRDKYEDEEELYEDDDRYIDEEEPRRRKGNRGGAMAGSRNKPRRQPPRRQYSEKVNRKHPDYYYDDEYDDKPMHKKPLPETNKNRNPSRKPSYEYEDDEDVDYKKTRRGSATETIIKPTSGTIFDRPRVAPKINLPVPKNVADQYSYKTKETADIDEYDEKPATNRSTEKLEKPATTPETHNAITTMRGNFKRPFMSRRPTSNSNDGKTSTSSPTRKAKPAPLDMSEDDEIQEGKANIRITTVRVKSPVSVVQKDSKRPQNHERRGYLSRINMFKTRHSLSTPEVNRDVDPDDFAEIDDSINEA